MVIDDTDRLHATKARDAVRADAAVAADGPRSGQAVGADYPPIGALVAQVYENAPMPVRAQLVERLLAPMSVYALISVAGGVFAQIKGRNAEWQGLRVGVHDIEGIGAHDVGALAERVLPASAAAVERLEDLIAATPALAGSGAASALLAMLAMLLPRRGRADRLGSHLYRPNEKPSAMAGLTHEYVAR